MTTAADGTERPKEAPRARGRIGDLLAAAQGESVKNAMDAGQNPHEYQISVDGKIVGVYKGKTAGKSGVCHSLSGWKRVYEKLTKCIFDRGPSHRTG